MAEAAVRERPSSLRERSQVQGRRGRQGQEDRAARSQGPAQERGPCRTHGGAHQVKKRSWGALKGCWVPHDIRDELVDFVRAWGDKTEIPACRFLNWIQLGTSKFHDWRKRYGKVNEHNAWVPRDHWLTEEEKRKIIAFAYDHPP